MAEDDRVDVGFGFSDDYTAGVKEAKKETEEMNETLRETKDSSDDANLSFLATKEAVDAVGGSFAKIRAGAEDLNIVTEEQAEILRKVEGVADLFTGTAELALGTMKLWTQATVAQRNAMIGLGAAVGAAGLAFAAVNAESASARAHYSVLTGVTTGLALAEFTLAAAKMSSWVAGAGPLAPAMAALIGGALAASATYIASTRASVGLQTGRDQTVEAEVNATGDVRLHQGERIIVTREGGVPAELSALAGRAPLINHFHMTLVGQYNLGNPAGLRQTSEQIGRDVARQLGVMNIG